MAELKVKLCTLTKTLLNRDKTQETICEKCTSSKENMSRRSPNFHNKKIQESGKRLADNLLTDPRYTDGKRRSIPSFIK